MNQNLSKAVKTIRLKPDGSTFAVAAGTTDCTSDVVDMAGYDGVRFIIGFGAITSGAVTSIKVQQGQASNLSDAADLAGTAQTVADTNDDKLFISEIFRPQERYLALYVDRGTQNAVIDFVIAELYGVRKEPITQHATVVGLEMFNSPSEGTA